MSFAFGAPDLATRRRQGPALLFTATVAVYLGAAIGGMELQRRLFPADMFLGGPLWGGMLFLAPVVIPVLGTIAAVQRIKSGTGLYRSVEIAPILLRPPWSRVTVGLFICYGVLWFFAVQSYWIANTTAITVHAPWLWRPASYAWQDAVSRTMYCVSEKHGWHPVFRVGFPDGWEIDAASGTQRSRFAEKLPVLLSLTSGVQHNQVGSVWACSGRIANLMRGQGGL